MAASAQAKSVTTDGCFIIRRPSNYVMNLRVKSQKHHLHFSTHCESKVCSQSKFTNDPNSGWSQNQIPVGHKTKFRLVTKPKSGCSQGSDSEEIGPEGPLLTIMLKSFFSHSLLMSGVHMKSTKKVLAPGIFGL